MSRFAYKIDNRVTICLIILLAVMVSSSRAWAQGPPADSSQAQRQGVRRVIERFGLSWERGGGIGVDRDGRVTGLRGIPIRPDSAFRLIDWVYSFLESNGDLFGIANPRQGFRLLSGTGSSVRLQQVVGGVDVYYAWSDVELSNDRTYISHFEIQYYPEALNVSPTPSIDSLEAGRIAQADPIHGEAQTYACCYELFLSSTYDGVHPFTAGGMHLVWKFGVVGGGYQGDALYMIDAHSGQILDARCGTRY